MASKRLTLVADELLGLHGGGLGTATSHLALALGRMGHEVDVLYVGSEDRELDPEWARSYEDAGVEVSTLERNEAPTEPPFFARMRDVAESLSTAEPDLVIVQDLGAPGYVALRLKQLGLAFERTLFVVFCHGTRRWITDAARKVRVLPGALAITMLERASIELADWVVSPSEYLLRWMQRQDWRLPSQTAVIPYLTRAGVTGETPSPPETLDAREIERIAFFGRLEERKGITSFAAALDLVEPGLLYGIDLEFVGVASKPWPPSRVRTLISERTKKALAGLHFATDLDQQEALKRLSRPGTLAVMASLEDNSPNTVYECLERRIPFIASGTGGTPELIASEDHERVLFDPTPQGIAHALSGALRRSEVPAPARAAFDNESACRRWSEVVGSEPRPPLPSVEQPAVDVIVVGPPAEESAPCLAALGRQRYRNMRVVPAGDRATGARAGTSPWLVFLAADDEPHEELLQTLVRAQRTSDADVVSCALHVGRSADERRQHFFLGEPGGLGVLSNGYGTVALVRRSLLSGSELAPIAGQADPDWQLLAGLTLGGARVVSVPIPLVTRHASPGRVEDHPVDTLLALQQFEGMVARPLESIARLAAGLAADATSARAPRKDGIVQRFYKRLSRQRA
jgi:glycosyltransferase involved in cell wall biosynthesis